MKKVTFAIMGVGNRGTEYGARILRFPEEAEIVAMADTRCVRLDAANKYAKLPEDRLFASADELLAQPKLADIMIIATQDAQHKDHAIRAMELGYDLLLEKPVSNKLEDCKAIAEAAKRLGRRVVVCHVLRYTYFYRQIKELIDSGAIGRLISVRAMEMVNFHHHAHSYVRGNWHNSKKSSPMILAKCCHDMDYLLWLTGKKCLKLNSFGSLTHFVKENCPEGATERCTDGCPHADTCIYNAPKYYLSRMPNWPTKILHPEPTEENIMEILRTTDYGRCVYQMDNDVVDHQTVNMLLEDDVTVTFQMVSHTAWGDRDIYIMGTEGEIIGDFALRKVTYRKFGGEEKVIDIASLTSDFTGHGGGDAGLIIDAIKVARGDEDFNSGSLTTIDRSVESHYVAFAAEKSRVLGGQLIDMEEFIKEIEG